MDKAISAQEIKARKRSADIIIKKLKELFPVARIALKYSTDWELLVAVILSAQCTDKKVNEVTATLFKKYKNLDDYVRARQSEFEKDIKPTGFFRNKAKNILATARIIKDKYKGKLPHTMEEMISLPGVGRKTANIILGNAMGIVVGIAVDTHVKRLSRLLGLTDNLNPDKIEQDLMKIIPQKEWLDFNFRLIEYGRTYCPAKKHEHEKCPLTILLKK